MRGPVTDAILTSLYCVPFEYNTRFFRAGFSCVPDPRWTSAAPATPRAPHQLTLATGWQPCCPPVAARGPETTQNGSGTAKKPYRRLATSDSGFFRLSGGGELPLRVFGACPGRPSLPCTFSNVCGGHQPCSVPGLPCSMLQGGPWELCTGQQLGEVPGNKKFFRDRVFFQLFFLSTARLPTQCHAAALRCSLLSLASAHCLLLPLTSVSGSLSGPYGVLGALPPF